MGITFLDRTSTSKSVTFVSPFDLSVAHTHSSPEDITFIPSSSLLTTLSRRNERQPLELLHFKNSQTSKYVRRQDSLCLGRCCQRCCCSSYHRLQHWGLHVRRRQVALCRRPFCSYPGQHPRDQYKQRWWPDSRTQPRHHGSSSCPWQL